jgi:hypothetical protein
MQTTHTPSLILPIPAHSYTSPHLLLCDDRLPKHAFDMVTSPLQGVVYQP